MMKKQSLVTLTLAVFAANTAIHAAPLPASEPIGYVNDVINPEDMARIPGTKWVIGSSDNTPGKPKPAYMYLIDADAKSARSVVAQRAERPTAGDPSCKPIPFDSLAMSGLGLRRKGDGSYQVMGVNRGVRMSVEFFDIGLSGPAPTFTWVGCLVMPDKAFPNAVVPVGDAGLAVTISLETDNDRFVSQTDRGEPTGYLLTWNPDQGFRRVPGSESALTNGIAIDPEQRHFYIDDYGGQAIIRLPVVAGTEAPLRVGLGGKPDNVHWTESGTLIVAVLLQSAKDTFTCAASGSDLCPVPFRIMEVDPKTMQPIRTLVSEPTAENYAGATTGLEIGDEVWTSSFRNTRIAIYRR